MARVEWRRQALRDLEAIEAYFEELAPEYARFLVRQLFERASQLERTPRMGRMVPEIGDASIREVRYRSYRIMYYVDGASEEVEVLALVHTSQQFGALDLEDEE